MKDYDQSKMSRPILFSRSRSNVNGRFPNKKVVHQQSNQLNSSDNLIYLQNFICPSNAKKLTEGYCNACCLDLPLSFLDQHLETKQHLKNRRILNGRLLAVNLFQISAHHSLALTESLQNFFANQNGSSTVIEDNCKFQKFLLENLGAKVSLTQYSSLPNEISIQPSDIRINIELVDKNDKNDGEILKIVQKLVREKCSNQFKVLNVPNLDQYERAFFVTEHNHLISLTNIHDQVKSSLIDQYMRIDKRVPVLMYNLKSWAYLCELDRPSKATYQSQVIEIMLIFFLQRCHRPILPNLHKKLGKSSFYLYQQNGIKYQLVEPIEDSEIAKINWTTKNKKTVGELWIDFFKFYLFLFDYQKTYVDIVDGCEKKKSKAFTVCNLIDGKMFPNNFSYQYHFNRLKKLMFEMYKHSCFFPYPYEVNNNNIDNYFQLIFSPENIKPEIDFKLTRNENYQNENEFDLRELWRLSVKLDLKIGFKQNAEKQKFRIYTNRQVNYPKPLRFCVLCKSNEHFVINCRNMDLPELQPIDNNLMRNCALILDLVADHYYKHKSTNGNYSIQREIDDIKNSLNRMTQIIYPNTKLEMYGSTLNGFGHVDSDLDFALIFNSSEPENTSHKNVLEQIGKFIRNIKQVKDVQTIVNAKVPIIKLKYLVGEKLFDCDISIGNRLAFCNTDLLRLYCLIDDRVAKLSLLIKHFAKLCQICFANQGGIKSYAFNIMIIHFLQHCHPPVLPCLQELDDQSEIEPEIIEGWPVKYFRDLDKIKQVWPDWKKNKQTVGQLLIDFLIFYTEKFDFNKNVVTIRQYNTLTKSEKSWTSMIAIEDPFLLTHNLTEILEIAMVNYVKGCLTKARNHFTSFVTKGFHYELRFIDVLQIIFNLKKLKGDASIPFGRGCQICFKIGHKKANCPRRYEKQKKNNTLIPIEFKIKIGDLLKNRQCQN